MNKHLDTDANNIATSLHKITSFVRNIFLDRKTEKDIPYITSVGYTAWDLISSIYESGWNELTDKNNKTFCQYILA